MEKGSGRGTSLLVGEPFDVEAYQAPSGLDLEQVHVYVRHGERTPVRTRMVDPPASIPEHWRMCSVARRFREAVNSTTTTLSESPASSDGMWFKRGTETCDGKTVANLCLLGDLTDVGKESTYNFGVALRRLYVDKLGFLPGTLQSENQVYFRSTNVPRTIESLEHIVHGLYPQTRCATDVIPSILVRNKVDENIISNIFSCPQLGLLELRFAEAAAARWNPRLQTLDERLSKYIKGKPIRVDGSPRASGILDTVHSAAAHGIKVPDDFWDPGVINLIESAASDEWFTSSQFVKYNDVLKKRKSHGRLIRRTVKTEQGRRLSMGRLLAEMSTKMQNKIEQGDKDPLKILVYSTHDTTVAALCSTFDVFDDKWPPFTSSVTFELFKRRRSEQGSRLQHMLSGLWNPHSKDEYYVRVRYKNNDLVLPLCAKEGDHLAGSPEFCALKVFQRRVKELTPGNWSAECTPEPKSA